MRWEDERYVRCYTRDSTTWLRWTWEARATFALLLRKVDRDGRLALDGETPGDAVALHTGLPPDIAERGMFQILKPDKEGTATAVIDGGSIALPNYRAAQETRSSDKKRSADYRERKGAIHSPESSRNVTNEQSNVTTNHTPSHAVTRRHSVPSGAGRGGTKDRSEEATDLAAVPAAPLVCTREQAMAAIASASGGRFVASPPAKGGCFQFDKLRHRPDVIAVCTRIGEWLKAGGEWRTAKGVPLDGRALGDINAWVAQAEAWDGKPIVARLVNGRRSNGLTPPVEPDKFSDDPPEGFDALKNSTKW